MVPQPRVETALLLLFTAALTATFLTGCATAPPAPTRLQWPAADLAYLKSPLEAAPIEFAPEVEAALGSAYQALRDGYPERADAAARDLAVVVSDPAPVTIIRAQVALLRGDYRSAIDRLTPIVARDEGWTAARWALGRAHDLDGDLVEAYEVLMPLASEARASGIVRQRLSELEPEVVELLEVRIDDAIREDRLGTGQRALELLERIAPDAAATHEVRRRLAHAQGDDAKELGALRALSALDDFEPDALRRLADLELAVGEPAAAMQAFEALLRQRPGDAELGHALERAKFRWRLQLLPRPVVELSQLPVLSRGDFAALTYWLVPTVRHGAPLRATIANDVLDHPMRDEIVRVVNLELMDVDSVHRFYPMRPVRSVTVLRTFLEVLARSEAAEPCTGAEWGHDAGTDQICAAAVRCGLLASAGECSPYSEVSGVRAVELGRAALNQLGAP